MTPQTIKGLIAAGILTMPALSFAATPASMDTCVKAFMDSLNHDKSAMKLRESHFVDTGMLIPTNSLTLTARDAHNNHALARAVCTVNSSGEVIDLQAEPVYGLETY